jgi:hypothetical protein
MKKLLFILICLFMVSGAYAGQWVQGSTITFTGDCSMTNATTITMDGTFTNTGPGGIDTTYGISGGSVTIDTSLTMGSASTDTGVFSMIKGTTGSDPTYSITVAAAETTVAQTVGDLIFTAADDVTITATGANISLDGAIDTDSTLQT